MSEEKTMVNTEQTEEKKPVCEEKVLGHSGRGMVMLFVTILLFLAVIPLIVGGVYLTSAPAYSSPLNPHFRGTGAATALGIAMIVLGVVCVVLAIFSSMGLKVMKPNEALVLTCSVSITAH